MSINTSPIAAAEAAKSASRVLAALPGPARDEALEAVHAALTAARESILAANARDMATARQAVADGRLSESLASRLDLGRGDKFDEMLRGVLAVRGLEDPLGRVGLRTRLDDGLVLERVSCPIGVLLVVFEARAEVVANIAALAIKSGNAAILKGGRESTESLVAIAAAVSAGLARGTAVPADAVQLVVTRDAVADLLALDHLIDLVIPRGGVGLVRHVKANTRIAVLGHADGLCGVYLAADADPALVPDLLVDAKTGYPAACNAVETLLVQRAALDPSLGPDSAFARAVRALLAAGVELRCDADSKMAALAALEVKGQDTAVTTAITATAIKDARPEVDYDTEFLSLVLAVKTVPDLSAAIDHINRHGSHHTDAILTSSSADAEAFMSRVDSAGVYWNASTRLADGNRYGFGTEVGISTNKLHARGPVGVDGLTTYKYKLRGTGQTAGAYGEGVGKRLFKHEKLPV